MARAASARRAPTGSFRCGWMSFSSPTSVMTAMPVFGTVCVVSRWASRSSAHVALCRLRLDLHERRELHEEEREVALRPSPARQLRIIAGKSVWYSYGAARRSTRPDTRSRRGSRRACSGAIMRVVEAGGAVLVLRVPGRVRHRRQLLALRLRLLDGLGCTRRARRRYFFTAAGYAANRARTVQDAAQPRVALQRRAAGPRFGRRAAPRGVDQAHRHLQRPAQVPPEEVGDGREVGRPLPVPRAPRALHVLQRRIGGDVRDGKQVQHRVCGARDRLRRVGRQQSGHCMFDCPLQTQTSPTSTSRTSTLFSPAIVMVNGPPARSGCSRTLHRPSRRRGRDRLPLAAHRHLLAVRSRAPHRHRHPLLQHRSVTEQRVRLHRGPCRPSRPGQLQKGRARQPSASRCSFSPSPSLTVRERHCSIGTGRFGWSAERSCPVISPLCLAMRSHRAGHLGSGDRPGRRL